MHDATAFEEDPPQSETAAGRTPAGAGLVVDLDGFEGPIDVLLQLAREQKVDITQIPILDLAEQYLAFVRAARRLRLELAADYLVMAAWLAYLKSRLLLPDPASDEVEPSGAEMAAALRFQLQRLEAMQDKGAALMRRPRLGIDVFARGEPATPDVTTELRHDCHLYDLLRAYADLKSRGAAESLRVDPLELDSVEAALNRLRRHLGHVPGWAELSGFLPAGLDDPLQRRAAHAATFAASLELCREGQAEMRQDRAFGPIYLRPRDPESPESETPAEEDT